MEQSKISTAQNHPTGIIETSRLLLKKITPDTYVEVFTKYSDAALMDFFGFPLPEQLVKEKRKHTEGMTGFNRSFLYFQLIEKKSGIIVGACGFHTWYLLHRRAELGYELYTEEKKRMGYMKEALREVVKYGFEEMNLNRIEAFVGPDNSASLSLVRGLGFTEEGLLKKHYNKGDQIVDSYVFGLLQEDYRSL